MSFENLITGMTDWQPRWMKLNSLPGHRWMYHNVFRKCIWYIDGQNYILIIMEYSCLAYPIISVSEFVEATEIIFRICIYSEIRNIIEMKRYLLVINIIAELHSRNAYSCIDQSVGNPSNEVVNWYKSGWTEKVDCIASLFN